MSESLELNCPICGTQLKITSTVTVEEIITHSVWSYESLSCCAEPRISSACERWKKKGIDTEKTYHQFFCFECGFIHNGIDGARKVFS